VRGRRGRAGVDGVAAGRGAPLAGGVIVVAPGTPSALPADPPNVVQTRTDLGGLAVHARTSEPYDRVAQFGRWTPQGRCTTRQRVLLRDGLDATSGAGCAVAATHWRSIYDAGEKVPERVGECACRLSVTRDDSTPSLSR
jgi:hypothetical protein